LKLESKLTSQQLIIILHVKNLSFTETLQKLLVGYNNRNTFHLHLAIVRRLSSEHT